MINTNVTKTGIKNGNTPLVTVETDILPTRATTKRAIPIGGVRIPIIIFNVVITPKKIKSILNCIAIGISIGNTKNCNARASMNIPRKSNSALIITNTVKGESATATNTLATRIATCSRAIISPKKVTVIIIKATTPVIAIASMQLLNKLFKVNSLYTNLPIITEYAAATMADSVGLNNPEKIPPIINNGVKIAQKDCLKLLQSCSLVAFGVRG